MSFVTLPLPPVLAMIAGGRRKLLCQVRATTDAATYDRLQTKAFKSRHVPSLPAFAPLPVRRHAGAAPRSMFAGVEHAPYIRAIQHGDGCIDGWRIGQTRYAAEEEADLAALPAVVRINFLHQVCAPASRRNCRVYRRAVTAPPAGQASSYSADGIAEAPFASRYFDKTEKGRNDSIRSGLR